MVQYLNTVGSTRYKYIFMSTDRIADCPFQTSLKLATFEHLNIAGAGERTSYRRKMFVVTVGLNVMAA